MINKKYILILITTLLMTTLSAKSITNSFIAEETAIDYYPSDNYVCINEYNLFYKEKNTEIKKDIESIKALILSAKYSKEKFGINDFFTVEESLTNEGKYSRGRYDLLTSETSSLKMIEDIFSKVLQRKVKVSSDGKYINLTFDGTGINITSYDAENAYSNGKEILLQWPNHLSRMELVFSSDVTSFTSILPYIKKK